MEWGEMYDMNANKLAYDGGVPVRNRPFPEWPLHGKEERAHLLEVLESGKWGGTGRVKLEAFEQAFASLQDANYAVTVANGTLAITVALLAAGVEPGDEVIMTPYTFIATATSALMFGAIPVFVDVEADTLLIDPDKVEAAITPRTKAILAVHIGGAPANLDRLKAIASKHGLKLIEDSAQAVGAKWDGVGVGAIGDAGTFSFQSSKNMTAGEGGIVLTNNEELYERAWSIANVGRVRQGGGWYQHEHIGWNLRMTELQAALLLGQMTRFEKQAERRERNGLLLTERMKEIDGVQVLRRDARTTRHAYHLYMFKLIPEASPALNKADFIAKLSAEGIPCAPGYVSLNQNKAILTDIRKRTGEERFCPCPVSERLSENEVVWLHQNLLLADEADVHDIADAVKKVIQSYG